MGPSEFTNPSAFFQLFKKLAERHAENLKALWHKPKPYTAYITKEIYPALAKETGLLEYEKTYWSIDCILFDKLDKLNFPKAAYARKVHIAIEHENVGTRSTEEMNKLQLLNIPLRVLITYPNIGKPQDRLVQKYNTIIHEAHELFDENDSIRRTLVIFGYLDDNTIDWSGFHTQNGKLVRL